MVRTKEALGNLVNYEEVSAIRPLEPPKIEKKDIPKFILCQNYDKALQKVERTMERYNGKVNQLKDRLQQSDDHIQDLKSSFNRVNPGSGFFVDKTNPNSVAKYNDRLDQARRLQERISDAIAKHNEIVADHNDAIREADVKLAELTQEALLAIDEDIVAVLDKCSRTVAKLSESANSEDRISAVETCFIEFKIFNSFESHIEGNVARKDSKEKISEVNKLYGELCTNKDVHNYLAELFHKNSYLIQKNGEVYNQIVQIIENVSQEELGSMTQSIQNAFGETFKTDFKYQGIIDPSELDGVVVNIHKTIDSINANIVKTQELFASTQTIAEAGVNAHQNSESLLTSMKSNLDTMRNELLFEGHFASDMIDEAVIDDFYQKDLRPAVITLREHIVGIIGEEQLDALIVEDKDRYFIEKAETAIKQSDILRLQAHRDQVAPHIQKLSTMIKNLEIDIQKAEQVPLENANTCRSVTSKLYILSCLPIVGFAFALSIISKIKKFAPAFGSANEIYRKLCTETYQKNKVMQKVILVLGIILGIGGLIVFLGFTISSKLGVNIGLPFAVLILYLITWTILASVGKELQAHIESEKATK